MCKKFYTFFFVRRLFYVQLVCISIANTISCSFDHVCFSHQVFVSSFNLSKDKSSSTNNSSFSFFLHTVSHSSTFNEDLLTSQFMSTSTPRVQSSICQKETRIFICEACSNDFFRNDLIQHLQTLGQEWAQIENDRDHFREKLNKQKEHFLIAQINQWKENAISNINKWHKNAEKSWAILERNTYDKNKNKNKTKWYGLRIKPYSSGRSF